MTQHKLILVAGARPNFMKIAPLMHVLEKHPTIEAILIHTGQHYDERLSKLFFEQLNIPKPDVNLQVGSGSHTVQTARIMEGFEAVCKGMAPTMVLVVGDVNSTVACTLVAAKMGIKTAHYEAGLRSRDRSMPEEINRLATDAISDYFFTTSQDATENLLHEGTSADRIFLVGNLMIDALKMSVGQRQDADLEIEEISTEQRIKCFESFAANKFGVVTLHRPANVDDPVILGKVVSKLCEISKSMPLIFPAHPRTYQSLQRLGFMDMLRRHADLLLIEPLGYLEFISLVRRSAFVLTDSGGLQEETTALGIPCLTLRKNTERPITIWQGTNKLIDLDDIVCEINKIRDGEGKQGECPPLWDGNAASRILGILEQILNLTLSGTVAGSYITSVRSTASQSSRDHSFHSVNQKSVCPQ